MCANTNHLKMKKILFLGSLLISAIFVQAQNISGNLTQYKNSEIKLNGFKGLNTYLIASTVADENGNFKLSFSNANYGTAYLISSDNKPLIVILSGEDTQLKGNSFGDLGHLTIEKGQENKWFDSYATESPARNQALSAWDYLDKLYTEDPLFSVQKTVKADIKNEIQRINKEDADFVKNLPADSYIKWYLPVRKLVSSVPIVMQYTPQEIPATIEGLRNLDFSDARLYSSGLLKDAVEAQFLLINGSAEDEDTAISELKKSVDVIVSSLKKDDKKLNEVTQYLFSFLEKGGFTPVSEYLATKLLNDDECGCTLEPSLTNQLEQYRKMKIGERAPEIAFTKDLVMVNSSKGSTLPKKLSDIQSKYKLIVFGSSWCPSCVKEIPKIAQHYSMWKSEGLEVVFVSLDTDKDAFFNFIKTFPFISYCDYEKWDSLPVGDYHVFATPTMYLLDNSNKILMKPDSVEQINVWLDGNQ